MKKFLITIIGLIFYSIISISQTSFITDLIRPNTNFYSIIQDRGNYYIAANCLEDSLSILYKIDSLGNKKSERIFKKDDTIFGILNLRNLEHNKFISFDLIFNRDPIICHYYYITEYDTNLNIINQTKYLFPDTIPMHKSGLRAKGDKKILYINSISKGTTFLHILDQDTIISFPSDTFFIEDVRILDDNYFYMYYGHSNGYFGNTTYSKIRFSDFQFEKSIDIEPIVNESIYTRGLFNINNNKLYLSNILSCEPNNDNHIVKIDTGLNIIQNQRILTDFPECQPFFNNFDSKNPNSLFLLNNTLMHEVFELTKIDSNLNIVYQRFITPDSASYIMEVFATNDDGCIVITNSQNDIRLYKFDENGLLPGEVLNYDIKISDFLIYPNPVNDILKVKKAIQLEKADFVLYNSLGQLVLQKTLNDNITELQVADLPKGLYIYNILQNNEIVDDGKIIKE